MSSLLKDFSDRLDVLESDLQQVLDLKGAVDVRTSIKALIAESKLIEPYAPEHIAFRKDARVLRQEAEVIIGDFLNWTAMTHQRRGGGGQFGKPRLTDFLLSRASHRWVKKARAKEEPSEQLQRAMARYEEEEDED